MKAVADKKHDKVVIAAECGADEGRRHVEKVELRTHDAETVKHVERKMAEKGVGRLDRHPADGLPLKHNPKKGHGGKYTWEGPRPGFQEAEAEAAVDEKDPNYVEEEGGGDGDETVVGEVETPKVAEGGVARVQLDPRLGVKLD